MTTDARRDVRRHSRSRRSRPRRPPDAPPPAARPRARRARLRARRRHPGRLRHDPPARAGAPRQLRSRALALLAIIGPGLIVMVGDNDAGGVATYSQAGQNYGTSLLWVLLLLIPVLIVNQEMVVRLGAVTGVGHAQLINERFGRFWGWFSVGDLFLLNFLTIVTEFIGVSLALGYFGVSKYVAVPIAAVGAGRDHRQRQLPLLGALDVRVRVREPARDPAVLPGAPARRHRSRTTSSIPGIAGGANSTSVLLIIAHRRDDGRAVAAVLPAVEHHRQADHAALDQLRAPRHLDRRGRRRARRRGADLRCRRSPSTALAYFGHFTERRRDRERARARARLGRRRVLRARAAQRVADRRRRADALDQLRVRRRVRDQELAAPQLRRREALLRDLRRR